MVSLISKIFSKQSVRKNNSEAVLTSTHNQCFRAKIRNIYIKKKKVLITWTCYPDDISILNPWYSSFGGHKTKISLRISCSLISGSVFFLVMYAVPIFVK